MLLTGIGVGAGGVRCMVVRERDWKELSRGIKNLCNSNNTLNPVMAI